MLTQMGEAYSTMAQSNGWSEEAPLPYTAEGVLAAPVNGLLYVGGGNNEGPLSSFYVYNPISNQWSELASMPGPRCNPPGAGVISNKLYFVGGWTTVPPLPNSQLWVYDPVANSWDTSRASMPVLSAQGAGGVITNKYYVTTPYDGYSGAVNFLHVYDPSLNTWTQLASSPIAHIDPGYGVIGGKFYVVGGANNSGVIVSQLDVYDPVANSWTTHSAMPTARQAPASAVVNGKLYVIGGYNGTNLLNITEVYDPNSDSWTTGVPMITSRDETTGASLNGVIYAIGGVNSGQDIANNEAFNPAPTLTIQMYPGITINADVGSINEIQYVNNLNNTNWSTLTNLVLPSDPYVFIDFTAIGQPQRFYRDVLLP